MRSAILHSALAVLAVLVAGAPARAAKAPAADDKHDHKAKPALLVQDGDKTRPATDAEVKAAAGTDGDHGHAEKGPLDFTGIKRYDLGIYTLIVFGLLMFVLSKFAWPHISEGLKKREAAIIGARDEAHKARQDAEELRVKLQKDYADAQDRIRAMLDEARRDADVLKAGEKEVGAREAQAERERAKKEIDAELASIREQLHQQTVQLAALMSAKAIGRQLSADDHRRLLDESLAELKNGVKA